MGIVWGITGGKAKERAAKRQVPNFGVQSPTCPPLVLCQQNSEATKRRNTPVAVHVLSPASRFR